MLIYSLLSGYGWSQCCYYTFLCLFFDFVVNELMASPWVYCLLILEYLFLEPFRDSIHNDCTCWGVDWFSVELSQTDNHSVEKSCHVSLIFSALSNFHILFFSDLYRSNVETVIRSLVYFTTVDGSGLCILKCFLFVSSFTVIVGYWGCISCGLVL